VPNQHIVELDTRSGEARLASGESIPYDLFVGIPVYRAPRVLERCGLAVDGWVPVEKTNLLRVTSNSALGWWGGSRPTSSGGPQPTARLVGPSPELAADKVAFASTRQERWLGS
jgi:hypothetical protein